MLAPLHRRAFWYLRHGETDWNRDGLCQGSTDITLNERGLAQAELAAMTINWTRVRTIVTSPLRRARQTADIMAAKAGIVPRIIDDLRECGFGVREGHPFSGWYDEWRTGRTIPDGAESLSAFLARAARGLNDALQLPGPVLIVAHGGVYWAVERAAALVARDAGVARRSAVPNATPIWHEPAADGHTWIRALPWKTEDYDRIDAETV